MTKMKYRKLGNSDLNVSVLGMGCWAFGGGNYWGTQSQDAVNDVVNKAIDYGVNYFDTAEMYNNGKSEESLGKAINLHNRRDDVIIGTKISPSNCRPETIEKRLKRSLDFLGTDFVDIYMLHWPIEPHSIEHFTDDKNVINQPAELGTAFQKLVELQQEGKIKYLGVSNHGIEQMKEIMELPVWENNNMLVVNELPYNLISRAIEADIIPYCKSENIGIFGYMALQQGILAGIYSKADDIPAPQAHSRHFSMKRGMTNDGKNLSRHNEEGCEDEIFTALEEIKSIASDEGIHVAQLSIAWAASEESIASTLVGSRKISELESNIQAVCEYSLSNSIKQKLNEITQPILDKIGNNPDYYEHRDNSRIH
jgi:myo-inositol catabolism protein IolS